MKSRNFFEKHLLSLARTYPLRGKERGWFNLQSFGQHYQFGIGHTTKLRLNFRESCTAQFQAQNRALCRKHFLRQPLLIAQFSNLRPNDILWSGHAPQLELDRKMILEWNCSGFGASYRKQLDNRKPDQK